MGRKIDMKKIENITRCQVTFSKRRSSVMKKANEVAVCCDVDVAFVAFSPSGRISKFCNQKRIEDVLHRYVSLPAEKRLNHINNVQEKMEKLGQLGHIKGDISKLQYLDKRIENLELQIKKSCLELQILETDLRDYELGAEQEPSLHQLSWCERNLNHSLQKVIARKNALARKASMPHKQSNFQDSNNHADQMEFESRSEKPFSSNFNENDQIPTTENPFAGQILMQLDPWISPYSARVRESIFQDLAKYTSNTPNFRIPSNMCNFSKLDSPNIFAPEIMLTSHDEIPPSHTPIEQSSMVGLLNHQQNDVDQWNNTSSVIFSDAIHMSSGSSCNVRGPRCTSTTTLYDEMGTDLQFSNLNSSQLCNMGKQGTGQVNKDYCSNYQETNIDNFLPEDSTLGEDMVWPSKVQKSNLWEWEDLLLDENLNLQDFF